MSMFSLAVEVGADDTLEQKYQKAISSYKAKDFKTSYDILSKMYLTRLSDARYNFYLGRSAFETGHYEIALGAFERVEMLDSSNLRNKLEKARTYFMLKMYEDAELAFKDVLSNPNIPQNVRTNTEIFLSKVKKVQKKSFTYAMINIDWIYDSNVNYGSLDDQYNINVGTLPSTAEDDDRALQLYADIVNIYDIGSKNGYAIKNRVKVYIKDYMQLDAYDVQYLAYTPSILYKETKFLAEFVFGLDILMLGDKEYLRTVSFTPRYEHSHSNTLRSIIHFKFQRKYFTQSAQSDLNSNHFELSFALQKILTPRSYIQANLLGIKEKKHNGSRIDVDYDEYRANAVYANQFTSVYGAELFAEYKKRYYADHSTIFGSTRVDQGGTASATINARVLKTLRFHLKTGYNRVESNQERYSYHKYTINIGMNKTF